MRWLYHRQELFDQLHLTPRKHRRTTHKQTQRILDTNRQIHQHHMGRHQLFLLRLLSFLSPRETCEHISRHTQIAAVYSISCVSRKCDAINHIGRH